MRHPHAQDTQPHSLVKGGGVGTQRWSIAEIGDQMRSKLAVCAWIGEQERGASIPIQIPEQLVSEQATPLTQGVDQVEAAGNRFPTVARVNDNTWQSLPERQHFNLLVDLEGCYAHFLVYREFTRSCRHHYVWRRASCN